MKNNSNVTYHKERLCNCLEEMKPMFVKHWEEVAYNKDEIKLDPDYDLYVELEDLGNLHVYTARDQGKLVGYSIFMINYHLHCKTVKYAMNDIIYVEKGYRKSVVADGIITYAEQGLEYDEGVDIVLVSMRAKKPFHRLMKEKGYGLFEHTYTKYVGGGK